MCLIKRAEQGHLTHLAHEVGDDAVEGGVFVAEALLAGAKGAEVLGGLGHDIGVKLQGERHKPNTPGVRLKNMTGFRVNSATKELQFHCRDRNVSLEIWFMLCNLKAACVSRIWTVAVLAQSQSPGVIRHRALCSVTQGSIQTQSCTDAKYTMQQGLQILHLFTYLPCNKFIKCCLIPKRCKVCRFLAKAAQSGF